MPRTIFKVAGVPEHFNYPWHLAFEQMAFELEGLQVVWQDYPGGTGAMRKALATGEADVALLLTEGALAGIAQGEAYQMLQFYVRTPLVWGIHTGSGSAVKSVADMAGRRYAISRMGSGSHLMAYVDAAQRGLTLQEDQLVVVKNLEGAREALAKGTADLFFWEKFTTKPYVDNGEFRRVGECPTPWPCFVMVARHQVIQEKPEALQKLCKVIMNACDEVMHSADAEVVIAERYQLQQEDVHLWFGQTRWASSHEISADDLAIVGQNLKALGLIQHIPTHQQLVWQPAQ